MPTMRAAVVEAANGPFRISELEHPVPKSGEVLVRIWASGVNPLDTKIRAGAAAHARHELPAILGIDLAGVVKEVGEGVTRLSPGDEVYGMAGGVGGNQGSLAQYAAVDERLLAIKPSNISMREAAALPLIFITAWEGLVDRVNVQAGQSVLVIGAGGGVGHIAVQIAVALGANVCAVDSGSKGDYLRSLGATPIDYSSDDVETYVAKHSGGKGFDVVYDTVGGAGLDVAFKAVARFGHVVSCLGWGTHALAPLSFKSATYSGVFTLIPLLTGDGREHHGDIMREATKLVEAGKVSPRLDPRTFTLETAASAHELIETRKANGKLVVDLD
ncbi:quinone oxidoreductase [Ensifer sp. Root142]|jgi:NADPH:quinone reductase|uniref:zinc-dependent alcohol dehydrogenase family protein n=1 Tax=unclassified Ensifer TaxID=2633371 RepID=UPI0007104030|nr:MULTISPECIES: zinc-dependent alcohol dehydrogenase family protein [unclassified Ensifer]KQU84914.1 quinone oxidoreductase [Ensifer sp. Root31]KQY76855.1 quinone oxidoreductase [Ensifer sp. Root142]PSS64213.1 quinone oxidoreductase [Ensifer sp. NM-2]